MTGTNTDLHLVSSLYRTTNAVVRELDRRLARDHNVTFVQAITLIAINNFERPQPRLVADFLSQQSQTVTGVLDRLERSGHVLRVRDLGDRRAVRLELTDSGRRLVRDVGRSLQKHIGELVGGLDANRRMELTSLLDEMEQAIQVATPR
jgi:DNA-binding MarR family transcriptional regulator